MDLKNTKNINKLKIPILFDNGIEIEEKIKINVSKLNSLYLKFKELNIHLLNKSLIITNKYIFKNKELYEKFDRLSVKTKTIIDKEGVKHIIVHKGKNQGNETLRIRPEKERVIDEIVKVKNIIQDFMKLESEFYKERESFVFQIPNGNLVKLDLDKYNDFYSKDIILEIEGKSKEDIEIVKTMIFKKEEL